MRPHTEGFFAFEDDVPMEDNPHPVDTREYTEWIRGWENAQEAYDHC